MTAPTRDPGVRRVLLLATLVGASAAVLGGLGRALAPPIDAVGSPVHLALALVVLFALAESFPVHIEYRREAHAVSLSTIPLVVAAFALAPPLVIASRVAGSVLALVGVRRQVSFKLAINLSAHAMDAAVGALVLQALVGGDPLSPVAWGAALVAAIVADLVGAFVVDAAIALYQGRLEPHMFGSSLVAVAATGADTAVALVAVALLVHEPMALVLLAVLVGTLGVSHRAYVALLERHRSLELVHEFTQQTTHALREGTVLEVLVHLTREHMHAERAWVFIGSVAEGGTRFEVDASGALVPTPEGPGELSAKVLAEAVRRAGATIVETSELARTTGHQQVVVAPLQGRSSAIGALVVADRSGNVRPYGPRDVRVFETLAQHTGVALDNDQLIARLRKEVELNEFQSRHDMLTGLGNRRLFSEALDKALAARQPVAVLIADLDGFKDVNDTLGHQNGDLLLCQVAARITGALRDDDVVARLGGDEFAVLLRDARSVAAARAAAIGVRSALEQPVELEGVPLVVGTSIGVAVAGDDGASSEELLRRADVAMVGSSRVDLQACKLEYSIVSPK